MCEFIVQVDIIMWSMNSVYSQRILQSDDNDQQIIVAFLSAVVISAVILFLFYRWDMSDIRMFESIYDCRKQHEHEFNLASIFDAGGTSCDVGPLRFFSAAPSSAELKRNSNFFPSGSDSQFSFANPFNSSMELASPSLRQKSLRGGELMAADSPISRLIPSPSRSDDDTALFSDRDLSIIVMTTSSLSERPSAGSAEPGAQHTANKSRARLELEGRDDPGSGDSLMEEGCVLDMDVQPFKRIGSFETCYVATMSPSRGHSQEECMADGEDRARSPRVQIIDRKQTMFRPFQSPSRKQRSRLSVNTERCYEHGQGQYRNASISPVTRAGSCSPTKQLGNSSLWASFPDTSLLADRPWIHRVYTAFTRHHRLVSMCCHPSARLSRSLRFLLTLSDMLCVVFLAALLLPLFAPSGEFCEADISEERCTRRGQGLQSFFSSDGLFERCHWVHDSCRFANAPSFLFLFSLSAMTLATPFRIAIRAVVEEVCGRKPALLEENELRSISTRRGMSPAEGKALPRDSSLSTCSTGSVEVTDDTPEYTLNGFSMARFNHMFPEDEGRIVLSAASAAVQELFRTISRKSDSSGNTASGDLHSINTFDTEMIPRRSTPFTSDMLRSDSNNIAALIESLNMDSRGIVHSGPCPCTRQRDATVSKITAARIESANVVALSALAAEDRHLEGVNLCGSRILLHRFILEQLSPLSRHIVRADMMYGSDGHPPGRVGMLSWAIAWESVILLWGGMCAYLLHTLISCHYDDYVLSWWTTGFLLAACLDYAVVEVVYLWWVHVHLKDLLRPQLRDIFGILSDAMLLRCKGPVLPGRGLRAVQHISAACRAARFPSVRNTGGAALLRCLDDSDVSICKRNRLQCGLKLGPISFLLLLPTGWFGLRHHWLHWAAEMACRVLIVILFSAIFLFHLYIIIKVSPFWLTVPYALMTSYILLMRLFGSSDTLQPTSLEVNGSCCNTAGGDFHIQTPSFDMQPPCNPDWSSGVY